MGYPFKRAQNFQLPEIGQLMYRWWQGLNPVAEQRQEDFEIFEVAAILAALVSGHTRTDSAFSLRTPEGGKLSHTLWQAGDQINLIDAQLLEHWKVAKARSSHSPIPVVTIAWHCQLYSLCRGIEMAELVPPELSTSSLIWISQEWNIGGCGFNLSLG
jgi:hypothetical protein